MHSQTLKDFRTSVVHFPSYKLRHNKRCNLTRSALPVANSNGIKQDIARYSLWNGKKKKKPTAYNILYDMRFSRVMFETMVKVKILSSCVCRQNPVGEKIWFITCYVSQVTFFIKGLKVGHI